MITEEEALNILREEGCSTEVINHIKAVTEKCVEIAKKISKSGHDVNIELVRIGALLHDIGRSKTHDISHGVKGAQILRERGLEKIAPFAEKHIGAGIPSEEAEELDIPTNEYMPESIEEKIVTYGDNLLRGDKVISFEEALDELRRNLGNNHPSLDRFRDLHEELKELGEV